MQERIDKSSEGTFGEVITHRLLMLLLLLILISILIGRCGGPSGTTAMLL